MPIQLPPPDQVRAIVVGIEHYSKLGKKFAAPGAAKGAFSFAHWLIERGVSPHSIELWVSLADGTDARRASDADGLGEVPTRGFVSHEFRSAMNQPDGIFANGQFLIIYFCGHGVIAGDGSTDMQHLLVLPDATTSQLRCIEIRNWRHLFQGSGWERFKKQLWVVEACCNDWGNAMKPVVDRWNPGTLGRVAQCAMFSCSPGEAASITADHGPRFTRELLHTLRSSIGGGHWPDFDKALKETAERLDEESSRSQRPVMQMGQDWSGTSIVVERHLVDLVRIQLANIPWAYKKFKPYLKRVLDDADTVPARELDVALDHLARLPAVRGVPPLLEFVARVAIAAEASDLRAWVDAQLMPQHQAELKERLVQDGGRVRLSLWYRDDGERPSMEGEFEILDAGGSLSPWPRMLGKPATPDTVTVAIGQWIDDAYKMIKATSELVVELYLPQKLLASSTFDTAVIKTDEGNDVRLGTDHAVLLRSTDRYKGPSKLRRWKAEAPAILSRLDEAGVNALHWAGSIEEQKAVPSAFLTREKEAPVWLGFESAGQSAEALLAAALRDGLPAVFLLRTSRDPATMEALLVRLQQLLSSTLDRLPKALCDWRSNGADDAGKTASLLLDDPAYLPEMWTSWTQPGG